MIIKNFFLILFLLLLSLTTACYKQIICNEPYIFYGSECCLDSNKNNICDKDESEKVFIGKNTLFGLQNTLSSLLSTELLLSKDFLDEETQFYAHKDLKFIPISSCTSGCAGSVYIEKTELKKVSVGYIIKGPPITKHQFYDYILSKKEYSLNETKVIKQDFENQFNSSDGLTRYFQKKDFRIYPFANFTVENKIIYNNFTKITSLSEDLIIEFDYAVINEYYVTYGSKKIAGFINRAEESLDFVQAISIYCRPDLVITLYGDKYDWRELLNKEIYPENVINQFESNRKLLLPKAKAILDLCTNKYAYGDFSIE